MRKLKWIICLISLLMLLIPSVYADDSYKLQTVSVDVTVLEQGEVNVVETLYGDFDNCLGVDWELPSSYEYDLDVMGHNVSKTYSWKISEINVLDYPYEYSAETSLLHIGDESTLIKGNQTIKFQYTMKIQDLVDDVDHIFEFALLPTIPSEVDCVSFTINMPKIFDIDAIEFTYDDEKMVLGENEFYYDIIDTSITGYVNHKTEAFKPIKMRINLGKEYFDVKKINVAGAIVGTSVVTSFLVIIVYILFGKNGLVSKTKITLPPDGLNSVSISYVCDGKVTINDLTSLFIEWANLGYLRIEEVSDVENLYLVKLADMGKERWRYEKKLFNALFYNRDEVFVSELDKHFYEYVDRAIKEIKLIYSNDKQNRVFVKSSLGIQIITFILSLIPIVVGSYFAVYTKYHHVDFALIIASIYLLFSLLLEVLWYSIVNNRHQISKWKYISFSLIGIILTVAFWTGYCHLFTLTINTFGVCYATLLCSTIIVYATLFMDRRTAVGRAWFGDILSLKDFILEATEDELKACLQDNPDYFYTILPYAYVLDISNVWFKKFADLDLSMPSWYLGKKNLSLHLFEPRYYRIIQILKKHLIASAKLDLNNSETKK